MASFSRGLRSYSATINSGCSRCLKFSTTSFVQSGHSRWSKIKHEKGVTDHRRSKANGILAQAIAYASKVGGPDPNFNFGLAHALVIAKKAGFPKASMEAAINRGQSKSSTGAALSNVVLETMAPAQVSMIIEAETDNSKRTLDELKHLVKKAGGLSTSASHLFEKKGKITFEEHENLGVDDVLDEAIEAGALDVTQDGGIVVWTEPNNTMAAAETLTEKLGLKVQTAEIVWDANEETKSPLDNTNREAIAALKHFLDQVQDHGDVSAIYANVAQGNLSDDEWEEIQDRLYS